MDKENSLMKDLFMESLNNNLDQLIGSYEKKIDILNRQIKKLSINLPESNTKIEENVGKLQSDLDKTLLQNDILLDLTVTNINKDRFYNNLDYLNKVYPDESITIQLIMLKKLINSNAIEIIPSYIPIIISNIVEQPEIKDEWLDLIIELFRDIFDENPVDEDSDIDLTKYYISGLQFFEGLLQTDLYEGLKTFISEYSEVIDSRVLDLNDTKVITLLSKVYFIYEMQDILENYINLIINEWDFIDSNVTKDEFVRLLWYSTYVGLDLNLIDRCNESLSYLKFKSPELKMYRYFYDVVKTQQENEGKIKPRLAKYMNKITVFDKFEKGIILNFLYSKIPKSTKKHILESNKVVVESDIVNKQAKVDSEDEKELLLHEISKLPNKVKVHPNTNESFQTRKGLLAIYDNNYNESCYYTEITINYIPGNREYFISKNQLKTLRNTERGKWINLVFKSKSNSFVRRERVKLIEPEVQSFHNKKVNNVQNSEQQAEIDLNSKSALRDLGYQITGLSRNKRWEILTQKALPTLGLKRVVDIIAFLIRSRKAMKNGLVRNKNAITEWEHDLEKLKRLYYKNNFKWPNTSV